MRTLLIDNYDSYTYNLYQLLASTYGVEPVVLRNDDARWDDVDPRDFDAVVVSPGPGRPQIAGDVGVTLDVVRDWGLPVLGVCLGHQALAWLSGADVGPAPQPRHGHVTRVRHTGSDLFTGLPQDFHAVRYHSLCVRQPLPPSLAALAWGEDGVLMAARHRERPWWGTQFHPESVGTEHGARLLCNFRMLTRKPVVITRRPEPPIVERPAGRWSVVVERIGRPVATERVFDEVFAGQEHAFWLDSSRVEPGLARFSFLGDAGGPHGEVLRYVTGSGQVIRTSLSSEPEPLPGSVFDVLDRRIAERAVRCPELPFDLACGYVGYFGYELKAECGGAAVHPSPHPDAVWLGVGRMVAVDHADGDSWVIALHDGQPASVAAAREWVADTTARLAHLPSDVDEPALVTASGGVLADDWLDRPPGRYLADIAECQRQLRAGESYEICLTNTVDLPFGDEPLAAYRNLRRRNPAPYAAYLRLGGMHVLCSSPERFLKVDRDGVVESKPIKGTAGRHPDPVVDDARRVELATAAKTRAENLMIVDLVRNDLGRICEIGSVTVPRLMHVESYATVHQLVSTIRGRLAPGVTAVDAVRACFPGGSMTGAPKVRTMRIIDGLERRARGVYSGALGFLGLSGTADLNIVIRTAVVERGWASVGTGGAIVLDSDPEDELEETLIKARTVVDAVAVTGGVVAGSRASTG